MPTFCRHNRLVQNCPICAREQELELRPVVSPGGRPEPRPRSARSSRATSAPRTPAARGSGRPGGMTVRRLARDAGDGYASALVPGLRAAAAAERLADELAFAATRLQRLEQAPPGLYAEVADPAGELEERTWLAVQIAVLGPLGVADGAEGADGTETADGAEAAEAAQGADAFATVRALRTTWASGESPTSTVSGEPLGPRAAADPARALAAYRAWAVRHGSQAAVLQGDAGWTPERRFDRAFERLGTVSGMDRGPRYDLLVTLGRLGVHALHGTRLHVGGSGDVTLAAKRILGIGDPMLLERRAADLAEACGLELEALDLGFFNWERGTRATAGLDASVATDPDALGRIRAALGLG